MTVTDLESFVAEFYATSDIRDPDAWVALFTPTAHLDMAGAVADGSAAIRGVCEGVWKGLAKRTHTIHGVYVNPTRPDLAAVRGCIDVVTEGGDTVRREWAARMLLRGGKLEDYRVWVHPDEPACDHAAGAGILPFPTSRPVPQHHEAWVSTFYDVSDKPDETDKYLAHYAPECQLILGQRKANGRDEIEEMVYKGRPLVKNRVHHFNTALWNENAPDTVIAEGTIDQDRLADGAKIRGLHWMAELQLKDGKAHEYTAFVSFPPVKT